MIRPALSALIVLLAAPALGDEGWSAALSFGPTAAIRDLAAELASELETAGPGTRPEAADTWAADLRRAVVRCWTVDVSTPSATVAVTVAFDLTPEGRIDGDVRLMRATGGDRSAQEAAFRSARRAILRCQGEGYPVPAAASDRGPIELTFDAGGVR